MSYPLISYTTTRTQSTFTTRAPDGSLWPLTLPRPLYVNLTVQVGGEERGPYILIVHAGRDKSGAVVARLAVLPDTPEGQAVMVALGHAGPWPVPDGASVGGVPHGAEVSEAQAMHLAGLPDFPEHWAIVPSADGSRLALMWGNACSAFWARPRVLGRFMT